MKSRISLAVTFGLLAAIGTLSWVESHSSQAPVPKGVDQVLATRIHVQGIYAAVCSYMQTHDAKALERVKDEGKQVSQLIEDLNEQLRKTGKKDVAANIDAAHQALREGSVSLLEAELETSLARREMGTATHSLQMTLTGMSTRRGKSNLPRSQIDLYLEQSAALQKAETKSQQALERFTRRKEALEKALNAGEEVHFSTTKNLVYPLLITILVFGLGFHAFFSFVRTRSSMVGPLHDLLRCVEAAAAGDMSRTPAYTAEDEVGRVSQAVGRLISVLGKSENLVYHLASLVESSGDAIISHTLDGKILSWNKGAQRIYGYSAEEVKGRSIELLITDDRRSEIILTLMRIRKGEKIPPYETVHQAKNGRLVQAFVRVAPILDSTRQVIGASFVAEELDATKHRVKRYSSSQAV